MISRQGEWVSSASPEETVMLNIETGQYLGFNVVGGRIWELIEEPITETELCERLMDEFDVSAEQCRAEVESFLVRVESAGAIIRSD